MGNIVLNYGVKTLEGTDNNVVTVSRSQVFEADSYAASMLEQVVIPQSTTDMAVNIPTIPTQVVVIENVGGTDVTVKFNATNGTAFPVPNTNGFIALATTLTTTVLYITNSTPNPAKVVVFIGG